MLQRTTTASRPLRTLASLVLAFAALAPIASSAHLALVRHVTCAEHGELVEIGPNEGTHATPHESRVTAASEADAHGHDHCAAASGQGDGELRVDLDEGAPLPCVLAPLRADAPHLAAPLLRFAPKTSPPV